jgi:hypothetical protein
MKTLAWFCALALVAFTAPAVPAQPHKPGPEHEMLKKFVGTWDTTMKSPNGEAMGTTTYKMELGGLWLTSALEIDLGAVKFQGKGMDGYDAAKKKYVSAWFDNMGTAPMLMEGTYDKDKKTMTLTGDGPGPDGKPTKWKTVSTMSDDDNFTFTMFAGDAKEPSFTIVYKRKK